MGRFLAGSHLNGRGAGGLGHMLDWQLVAAGERVLDIQIRNRGTDGRACYDKKISEGKTPKEALRALKRCISNTIYAAL